MMPTSRKRKVPKIVAPSQADLGQAIRELRLETGMTQADLASKTGHSISYMSELENGKRNPTWVVLMELAQALGAPISKITGRAENL